MYQYISTKSDSLVDLSQNVTELLQYERVLSCQVCCMLPVCGIGQDVALKHYSFICQLYLLELIEIMKLKIWCCQLLFTERFRSLLRMKLLLHICHFQVRQSWIRLLIEVSATIAVFCSNYCLKKKKTILQGTSILQVDRNCENWIFNSVLESIYKLEHGLSMLDLELSFYRSMSANAVETAPLCNWSSKIQYKNTSF